MFIDHNHFGTCFLAPKFSWHFYANFDENKIWNIINITKCSNSLMLQYYMAVESFHIWETKNTFEQLDLDCEYVYDNYTTP